VAYGPQDAHEQLIPTKWRYNARCEAYNHASAQVYGLVSSKDSAASGAGTATPYLHEAFLWSRVGNPCA
jgi:hypothetical protein